MSRSCCYEKKSCEDPESGVVVSPPSSCWGVDGKRCVCLPYNDRYMISAQILAIAAMFVSWIWWVTHLLNLLGMVLYGLFWCLRVGRGGMYVMVGVGLINSMVSLAVGIYVSLVWSLESGCTPVFWEVQVVHHDYDDDDFYNLIGYYDKCSWQAWASIAIANSLLWAMAAWCLWQFVRTGRHAGWEEKHAFHEEETDKTVDTATIKLKLNPNFTRATFMLLPGESVSEFHEELSSSGVSVSVLQEESASASEFMDDTTPEFHEDDSSEDDDPDATNKSDLSDVV